MDPFREYQDEEDDSAWVAIAVPLAMWAAGLLALAAWWW